MKKIFLVKKDVTIPTSNDNWLVMNSYDFAMFIRTPEGQARKRNFAQLDACSMDEYIIYAECGEDKARKWRSEKDEHDYLVELEKKSGFTTFSYDSISVNDDELSGEELLIDTECDIEEEVLVKMKYEELYRCLSLLKKTDQHILYYMYLKKHPLTEAQYAEIVGKSQQTIHYQKCRALQRLKNILEI